jgi:transposase
VVTLFLPQEMLIRVFLGWLRGEPRHCTMVAIPTHEEEDARRPSRERDSLVGECTRIINRIKAALVAFAASSRNCSRHHSASAKVSAYGGDNAIDQYALAHVRPCTGLLEALGVPGRRWQTADGMTP